MKRKLLLSFITCALTLFIYSQETASPDSLTSRINELEKKINKFGQLSFSGYVQAQWTWDESKAASGEQNDFSVRRGRLKAQYANKYGNAVIQLDVTEDGVNIKDVYLRLTEPSINWLSLKAGVFDRPFGYEISYSSSRRESPERSRVFQTLFPKERDLGFALHIKGPNNTVFKDLSLEAGLFTGNGGQAKETDSGKDFIGHLSYSGELQNISYGVGASLYAGGVKVVKATNDASPETLLVYKYDKNGRYYQDTDVKAGDYLTRRYYGIDGQFSVNSFLGTTTIRAEYLWGTQPGTENSSQSPTGKVGDNIYVRKFIGYYAYLIQTIGKSKHTVVAKFDSYDPNTVVSGDNGRNTGDISYHTFGFGWLFKPNPNVRIMAFYEIPFNEKGTHEYIPDNFRKNISDDLFTLRLQYAF